MLRIVNLTLAGVTIAFNILANALPLNGLNTAEISDRFAAYFVPAGYVFAVWGLIYVGMVAFGLYQVAPSQRDNPRLARIGWLFALSCLANMAWLWLWHHEQFVLTVPVMVVLLLTLIAMYLRLDIGRVQVSRGERWCVDATFSLYLGWISVATIANVATVLVYGEWGRWGISAETWTLVMLATTVVLAAAFAATRRDVVYLGVLAWALVGIAVKPVDATIVTLGAWLAAAAVGVMLAALLVRRGRGAQALP